ncbi:MAG: phospho-N-acetylmuramoyl-pentapeptide-transferase [Chloroflexi bacterium]|jgi:phospho-N-acetylmuramoyl-pentapeptide-transferase|nr:MAG: phospho-N-acetylmuramoyl-pentapeptide-transferase [Chloroflexota bacterium]RLT50254.1 MAG: phospho-N-acetylmuramoyl-pentapeptide-transferase [Chloroflexota bacterium]
MNNEGIFSLTLASITFLLAVIWGGPFLELLRRFRIVKQVSGLQPESHDPKSGTPTMGGLMIVVPVLVITALLNIVNLVRPVTGRSILLPLGVMVAFTALGLLDDWEGMRGIRRGTGLRARIKFLYQLLIACGAAWILYDTFNVHSLAIPGFPRKIDIGWLYLPIAVFIITATSNAVNLTDGLDGLAGMVLVTAFIIFGFVGLLQDQVYLVRFCFTLVGALFAFLWYNFHPAELFMGDTGSLPLGAVLAVVALMTGQWLLLPLVAVVPLMETVSVMVQVGYFKWSGGERIFRMAPIHHHFELSGWSETQVVQRFWLISIIAGLIAIAFALL